MRYALQNLLFFILVFTFPVGGYIRWKSAIPLLGREQIYREIILTRFTGPILQNAFSLIPKSLAKREDEFRYCEASKKLLSQVLNLDERTQTVLNAKNVDLRTTIDPRITRHGILTTDQTIYGTQNFGRLGYSVAGAGDVNADGYHDVIVGLPYFDNGTTDEGIALVYYGSDTGLDLNNAVLLECNQSSARMGTSVSKAGDVNGDGFGDVIVGAPLYNNGQLYETGAAFLYYGSASGITPDNYKLLPGYQGGALTGSAVSSAADINKDGFDDVIYSAPGFDVSDYDEGIVIVCYGSADGLNAQAADTISGSQSEAWMGYSLSGAGDINNDGFDDIIIGAPHYDNGQKNAGMALIYYGSQQEIKKNIFTLLDGSQADAHFGWAVSSANTNNDLFSDVAIGAPGFNSKGAVFTYEGSVNGISAAGQLLTQAEQNNAELGSSLANVDINGDNYSDLVIGSPRVNEEGAVFISMGSSSGLNTVVENLSLGGQLYARYGSAVSEAADINGDGYNDVIVGAPLNGASDQGAAFVLYGKPNDPLPVRLARFTGEQLDRGIRLMWQTTSEVNSDRFEIFRSTNDMKWTNIGTVNANGQETGTTTYSFVDLQPLSGVNLYKLKMIDKDESFCISRIVYTISSHKDSLIELYPNPVSDIFEVHSQNAKSLTLCTATGTVILRRFARNGGELLDISNLEAGVYLLHIEFIDGSKTVKKLVKN